MIRGSARKGGIPVSLTWSAGHPPRSQMDEYPMFNLHHSSCEEGQQKRRDGGGAGRDLWALRLFPFCPNWILNMGH